MDRHGSGRRAGAAPARTGRRSRAAWEFLALLELSPLLRTLRLGIPVVFLVAGLGAPGHRLPQAYSDSTGRPGWSYSGALDPTADDPFDPLDIVALPELDAQTPGAWRNTHRRPHSKPGDHLDLEVSL